MRAIFIIITIIMALAGCGIASVSESAIHEILSVLAFIGAAMSLGIYAVICRLDDIKEVLRKRR